MRIYIIIRFLSAMSLSPRRRSSSLTRNCVEELKNYIDDKLDPYGSSHGRKVKPAALKQDSNQYQYDKALETHDEVTTVERAIKNKDYKKAAKHAKRARKLLEKRLKVIKMADRSDYGWMTVKEYLSDEIASDSDDDKRIKRAEAAAAKKAQRKQDERGAKRRRFDGPSTSGAHPGFGNRQFFRGGERKRFKYDDRCFACGLPGHWRAQCSLLSRRDGKGAPEKTGN